MAALIEALPKAELHVHLEGTAEPELLLAVAERNGVLPSLPFADVASARAAYDFADLQQFLDLYDAGCNALLHEQDFYELAWAYLQRAAANNVVVAELMFDAATHTRRGVPFAAVVTGISRAAADAGAQLGVQASLILCFQRHHGPEQALQTLKEAEPFKHLIAGVGLDSTELGWPPSLWKEAFARAKQQGYRLTAHAGEEGPAAFVWEALRALGVERIDHGVRSLDDPELLAALRERQTPLTVCPLSNLKLKVYSGKLVPKLRELLSAGLLITINSDDPAYFGGYLNANYAWLQDSLGLSGAQVLQLVKNGFRAAWLPEERRQQLLQQVDAAYQAATGGTAAANGGTAAANGTLPA